MSSWWITSINFNRKSILLQSERIECIILLTGVPDAPTRVKLVAFQVDGAKTVCVNVSWTPGYSGGYPVDFAVLYRVKRSGADLVEEVVGHPDNNICTIQGLFPETEYQFTVQSANQVGKSRASVLAQVSTPGNNDLIKFYIFILKLREILRALSLADRCVEMRVCKHGCDVLDSCIFFRNIL